MTVVLRSRLPVEECAIRLRRIILSLRESGWPAAGTLVGSVGQDRSLIMLVPLSRYGKMKQHIEQDDRVIAEQVRFELEAADEWRVK